MDKSTAGGAPVGRAAPAIGPRAIALAVLLLGSHLTPAFGQDSAAAIAQVRAAEVARFTAQIERDTSTLRELLADDLTYTHSNALTETKAHFIETVASGRIVYDSLVPVDMVHRVYGNTAVGNGKVHVQVTMNGRTLRLDLLFTTVHVRRRGRWQLVAWQSTRVP